MTSVDLAKARRRTALRQAGVQTTGVPAPHTGEASGAAERAEAAKVLLFPGLPETPQKLIRRIVVKRSPDPWKNATLIEDFNTLEEARDFMPIAA